jgi:DNA-binding transcriptional LysR family regulator
MIDPRLLASFREVAVRHSFSAAAEALGFTQPAISQHVSRLERQMGTRLLERDGRGVHLTVPGEVMLRHADKILEDLRRAEAAVRQAAGLDRAPLRVAAFPTVAAGLLPGAARELRSCAPDLRFDLAVLEPDPAIERLLAGGLDVAMVTEDDLRPVIDQPGLEFIPVLDDPMLVALPTEHHLAGRPSIDLADLRDEQWLLTSLGGTCADSNIVLNACRAAGFAPNVRYESDDYGSLQGMAAAGMGVALVPSLAVVAPRSDVVLRPISGRPPMRRILAVVRTDRSPAVDTFVEAMRVAGRPRLSAVA